MKRSENYRNLFNPATGFFAPRMADGRWVDPFDPQLSGGVGSRLYFAENNAWTWNFSVQQNIPDLIKLSGGNDSFIKRLDRLFNEPTKISKWQFMGQFPDATGLNGKELSRPFISHSDIVNGGKLQLGMGDRPNKKWGR